MKKEWLTPEGAFKRLKAEEQAKLDEALLLEYKDAEVEHLEAKLKGMQEKGDASAKDLETVKQEIELIKSQNYTELREAMKKMGEEVRKLKQQGVSEDSETFKATLKRAWDNNISKLEDLKSGKSHLLDMTVKAEQTYGDITSGSDFAQMRAGVFEKPIRQAVFRSLFSTIPVNTEFYKYTEVDTVIRDAKNVAKCAPVTSTTKETLVVRSIETKVIKDMLDFCTQFVADYSFMESRIRKLLFESVALRVDQQILLGTGTGEETFSIDSVSSEFSAANPACNIAGKVQDATVVDLILGMQTQIEELGLQNAYMPDTVIINRCDWFVSVESRKNANGNYLDERVTYVNGQPFIGGMRVITSPIVAQNTLYVFDSTKGEIVDRGLANVSISFENRDNWEKEIGTIKAYERLNFLVANNNANAFMKSSDVTAAVTAITKP